MTLNLGHKLIGGTLLLLVAVSLLFTYPKMQEEQRQIEAQFEKQGHSEALSAASSCVEWMITEDYSYVDTYLQTLSASKPGLVFAHVTRDDGQIIAEWTPGDDRTTPTHASFSSPIILEGMEDEPLGRVTLGVSNEWVAALFEQRVHNLLVNVGLMVATLGALLWMLNRRLVSRPIEKLDRFADDLGAGDLETSISLQSKDELGNLAATMDAMRRRLRKSYEEVRQQNEKLLEVDKLKDEFIGTISHEMRTPMNGVIGMTSLLTDTAMTDEQREYVATIQGSSNHLLRLINDILDMSRLQAGRMELSTDSFDVHDVLYSVAERVTDEADMADTRLLIDISDDVPMFVRGDAARLRQVLTHIGSNAAKFTDRGEITFSASVANKQDDGALAITFAVHDTGIGIAAEHIGQIFETFSQADNSDTRSYGGSGIGLTIASNIVDLMGSKIEVDSELGKGSTFRFTADLHALPEGETAIDESQDEAPVDIPKALSGKRVLVVVDHACERRHVVAALERAACEIVEAEDGGAALQLIADANHAEKPFDLAVLDAGIDASFLAHGLRDGPAQSSIPALLLHPRGQLPKIDDSVATDHTSMIGMPARGVHIHAALAELLDRASRPAPTPAAKPAPEAVAPEAAAESPVAAAAAAAADHGASLEVLIVEDNTVNQTLAKRVVAKQGHRSRVAANGQEALDAYDAEVPDVILMDCQMPVMDGFDATRSIREREQATGIHTPIIALTAHAMAGDRQKCIDAGMDDYIPKPFKPADIAGAFERWTSVGQNEE